MRINYSINSNSKCFLYSDVSFRQGVNHIGLGLIGSDYGLSVNERIKHVALGSLKLIPGIGHVVAFADTLLQRKTITVIKLTSTNPYERGVEHGRLLKNRIKQVYEPILKLKRDSRILNQRSVRFEKSIPENLKYELKGLAKGSGYSYQDVLLIHTFLDADPGNFGCTSMAVKETAEKCEKIAAANHSINSSDDFLLSESEVRRQAFLNVSITQSEKSVLKSAGVESTIQSMVFDPSRGKIILSSKGAFAANGNFKKFKANSLFKTHKFSKFKSDHHMRLFRNLDWPWYFLGQETVVLTRPQLNGNETVSISWPGYIGTLSGMNNQGLALSANQCGYEINRKGIPNPLLFTSILDNCKNVDEATLVLEKGMHASSMNLMMVDQSKAKSYELEGQRELSSVGEIN